MTSIVHFAVRKCHIDWNTLLWEMPIGTVILLMREEGRINGDDGITLEDKEVIDKWPNMN